MNDESAKRIGIGVVEHLGRFLVGVRSNDQVLGGHAEFPGGKCEVNEPPRECVVRECLEETGIAVEPVEQLDCIEFEYPHGRVELHFWLCRVAKREPPDAAVTPSGAFCWEPVSKLASLNFPEANTEIVNRLVAELS